MERDVPKGKLPSVTLETLVGATLLSVALLVYGAYGLYKNDLLLPTRVGVQHLRDLDVYVLYAVVLIAVPTNIIRLIEWSRDGDGSSPRYKTADVFSKAAVYAYMAYCIFGLFRHGA
jgi:hypothetical protein